MKKVTIVFAALMLSAAANAQSWSIDKGHSRVGFAITHLTINEIDGDFKSFDGKITSSKPDFSDASIEFTGDVNSINTDVEARDNHLKSPDFFDVTKFGEATYTIVSGAKTNAITYDVKGKLTIKGKTQDLNCKMVIAPNGQDINVGGGFMFDRSQFDVRYGSDKFFDNLGNNMIKNEVIMTVNLQGKKQ